MSKITVICPVCHLKFYVRSELSGFDAVSCIKEGGHFIIFRADESNPDRKIDCTIDKAIEDIEEGLKQW